MMFLATLCVFASINYPTAGSDAQDLQVGFHDTLQVALFEGHFCFPDSN